MKSWKKILFAAISTLCLAILLYWGGWLWNIEHLKQDYRELVMKGNIRISQDFSNWSDNPTTFEIYIENSSNKLIEGEFVIKGTLDRRFLDWKFAEHESIKPDIEMNLKSLDTLAVNPKVKALLSYLIRGNKRIPNVKGEPCELSAGKDSVSSFTLYSISTIRPGETIKITPTATIPPIDQGYTFSLSIDRIIPR